MAQETTCPPRRHCNAYNYPVTPGKSITVIFMMFMGVGIVGTLASILVTALVGVSPAPLEETAPASAPASIVEREHAPIENDLADIHQPGENMVVERSG